MGIPHLTKGESMRQLAWLNKIVVGASVLVALPLALGACGPRVISENEDAVVVKSGPWYPAITAESSAQSYCEHRGKRPSYEGGHVERGSLWYIYYFDCVGGAQS